MQSKPALPPFTEVSVFTKVRLAENAWDSRDRYSCGCLAAGGRCCEATFANFRFIANTSWAIDEAVQKLNRSKKH